MFFQSDCRASDGSVERCHRITSKSTAFDAFTVVTWRLTTTVLIVISTVADIIIVIGSRRRKHEILLRRRNVEHHLRRIHFEEVDVILVRIEEVFFYSARRRAFAEVRAFLVAVLNVA